jgi:hypothetical protein
VAIFARPVQRVQAVRLFAAQSRGYQALAWQVDVVPPEDNALVVPIPVRPAGRVEPIDMAAHAGFFGAAARAFGPALAASFELPPLLRIGQVAVSLHRSPSEIEGAIQPPLASLYGDHAFVVARFAKGAHRLPPVGCAFESRHATLFFPTLRAQGGPPRPSAFLWHDLLAQRARLGQRAAQTPRATGSADPRGSTGPAWPAFVDPDVPFDFARVTGWVRNQDTHVSLAPAA